MSEIKTKVEAETKELKELSDLLIRKVSVCLSDDMESLDTNEIGQVFDMIKDLADAKEKCIKAMYYEQIMDAMEDSDYGEDYDEDGPIKKGYRGRSARTGRFVHRPYTKMMNERDMDKEDGRMYYTEYTGTMPATIPNMTARGYEEAEQRGYDRGMRDGMAKSYRTAGASKYDMKKRNYTETKEMNPGNSEQEREAKVKSLDAYLSSISEDVSEMIMDMDNHQKTLLKNRLQALQNKIV